MKQKNNLNLNLLAEYWGERRLEGTICITLIFNSHVIEERDHKKH